MSWSKQVSAPSMSGRSHVFEPKVKFVKGGGYIIEPVASIGVIMQAIRVTYHEGLIAQAWYHDTELAIEQRPEHHKTVVSLTEIMNLEFSYLHDGRIWVDGFMQITPEFIEKQRQFYEHRRWLKRVNPTLYRIINRRRQGGKA